jgi:protoporphyrin/coproporphyrin ferrochelatase
MELRVEPTAILLMAYGTPNSPDEIEPYYTDIRGGRKPTPELLQELTERYQRIGGKTPLLNITRAQASALQAQLGESFRVYIGMRHWHPYIAQTVNEIVRDGARRVIAIALAPHYSRFSIEGYLQRVREGMEKAGATFELSYIKSWKDHPLFLRSIAERMEDARKKFDASDWKDIEVLFSAHSLPERILQSKDPYPQELRETCEGVEPLIGLKSWRFAFQSAGRTGEKWLGPEILATLDEIAHEGKRRVLIAPIGFVADHLEILYDIDVECAARAQTLGIEMHRIESPNATPTFIAALAAIARAETMHERI